MAPTIHSRAPQWRRDPTESELAEGVDTLAEFQKHGETIAEVNVYLEDCALLDDFIVAAQRAARDGESDSMFRALCNATVEDRERLLASCGAFQLLRLSSRLLIYGRPVPGFLRFLVSAPRLKHPALRSSHVRLPWVT
jgi:hypothetical protein